MEPPRLPTIVDELDPWRVYADALLEREEPLGHFLSLDLSLGDRPPAEALQDFRAKAARRCRSRTFTGVEWMLGMARTLIVRPDLRTRKMTHARPPWWVAPEALAEAADLVRRPAFSRLRALRLALGPRSLGKFLTRLFDRLPPSCTRLELDAERIGPDEQRQIAAALPSRFSELRLTSFDEAVLERLGPTLTFLELGCTLGADELGRLEQLVPRAQLVAAGASSSAVNGSRLRLGWHGDGAFVELESGATCVLRRTSVDLLQRTFGTLGVHAQLTRAIPETWSMRTSPVGVGLEAVPFFGGSDVMRHADGAWSVSAARNANTRIAVEDAEDATGPVPITEGSVVRFGSQRWRFAIQR